MTTSRHIVFNAVLDAAANKPVAERIILLRATAEIIGEPKLTQQLHAIADELDAAERKLTQFRFNFSQGGKG